MDEVQYDDFHIFPVVWIKITNDNQLPKSKEEIDELPFLISKIYTYGEFLSRNYLGGAPFYLDNNLFHYKQFLVAYRWILENTSKRVIPKDLIFLGNFEKMKFPQNEFLQYKNVDVVVYWKYIEMNLFYGIFEKDLKKNKRTKDEQELDTGMVRYVLKQEGKKFEDYLKYLDKNGIKY